MLNRLSGLLHLKIKVKKECQNRHSKRFCNKRSMSKIYYLVVHYLFFGLILSCGTNDQNNEHIIDNPISLYGFYAG